MTQSADRMTVRRALAWLMPLLALACKSPGSLPESEAAVPAVEIGPAMSLAEALTLLQAQLDTASAGLDEAGVRSMARVETISDRLLETRLPFAWISAESYSLEARLRQIQSRADRAEALRTGGARRSEDVVAAIADLRAAVSQLQADLAAGGGEAPREIQRVLNALDSARR